MVIRSPCQENYPTYAHPSAHKSLLESANLACTRSVHLDHGGGGVPGPDPLRRLPPPSLPGFGVEVPDHGRQRRPKEILLDLVEGEKMGFHPMCLYSKYPAFLGEPNSG